MSQQTPAKSLEERYEALKQETELLAGKLDSATAKIAALEATLEGIFQSNRWKTMNSVDKVLTKLLPYGSARRTLFRSSFRKVLHQAKRAASFLIKAKRTRNASLSAEFAAAGSQVLDLPLTWIPKVTIVSVLYRKEKELPFFLESIYRQDYPGEIEIVLVDDCSPDGSATLAEEFVSKNKKDTVALKIIRNEANSGNCTSRNRGIEASDGEIIIIVDADCMLSRSFVRRHVSGHSFNDCSVVIGPFNLETNGEPPLKVLEEHEKDAENLSEAQLQDLINTESFLNCITRNFSVRRTAIDGQLFDNLFSYSKDPRSGYGWEDVEMGYRLYLKGARVKFIPSVFTIHVSHPTSADEKSMPLRSLLNFRRLVEKHPEIALVARRWFVETYKKIDEWCDKYGHPINEDRAFVNAAVKKSNFVIRTSPKKLRVLTYRWHCAHQYELYKLPHDFTLVTDLGTGFTRRWSYEERPLRGNAKLVSLMDVNPRDFDVAILHFDENVLSSENTNGVIGSDWGMNFKWMRENLKIPMVAICHGTPQFKGQYNPSYLAPDLGEELPEPKHKLVEYVGDLPIVVNSHQALREWGFKNARVIWQGFDPTEFSPTTYQKGVLSLGRSMKERHHYRGYTIFQQVIKGISPQAMPGTLSVQEPDARYPREHNEFARIKFKNYIDAIRQYSVYFNPTIRSPMPRSRGEAMMCGLATVSYLSHDVDMFIKNGWNGFYSTSPEELREHLEFLVSHPEELRKIGARSRETALDLFNHDRYLDAWVGLLKEIVG